MPSESPLNVEFWSLQYSAREDDAAAYTAALNQFDDALGRARALWEWKDLSRGVDFAGIDSALSEPELSRLVEASPAEAVARLGETLVDNGALANATIVTPAFLLHLADSGPEAYSRRFPIFDVRCWVAYVYLTRQRTGDAPLPKSATTSASRFGEFSDFFQEFVPADAPGRQYEQALFRFGSYISSLPTETIDGVDKHLRALENAVTASYEDNGVAIVRPE